MKEKLKKLPLYLIPISVATLSSTSVFADSPSTAESISASFQSIAQDIISTLDRIAPIIAVVLSLPLVFLHGLKFWRHISK